jgi:choline kinase
VVIAAAGLGSRLGHGIPKCLVEVNGRTLIERQLGLFAPIADIRVVVGYMEQAVMDSVRRVNEDVIFVRNPRYRETTTQDSYALGASNMSGSCLFLDADIIFDPSSLARFLDFATGKRLAIGVTEAKTDHAVFAITEDRGDGEMDIISFSREPAPLEWANIVCAPADSFWFGRGGTVFEALQAMLPAPAHQIISYEVDTQADLDRAKRFADAQIQSEIG